MNVLLTGGAGYVGSHAARLLKLAGHEAWIYDNLAYGHRAAVPQGRFIDGDLLDGARLAAAMRDHKIDAVMHFAAFCLRRRERHRAGQVLPQQHRRHALAARRHARRRRREDRLLQHLRHLRHPREACPSPKSEKQSPINPYGYTKLVIEHALADYAHAYGMGYAALRYFNASGAAEDGSIGEDHDPETHLIPLVLQVALGQRDEVARLRRRLPHARRHLHPRLHPRRRPGPRPHRGARTARARRRAEAQPRHRRTARACRK